VLGDAELAPAADRLLQLASCALTWQRRDGSFPAGHNGPHAEAETPVRVTAGWLYTFAYLASRGEGAFIDAAHRAADYLLSSAARPMGAAFFSRYDPHKNLGNGLVGQAFVLEPLLFAAAVLGRPDCREVAAAAHGAHYWNEARTAWHDLNVDGSHGPLNPTFNQQLWFAALGCRLDDRGRARAECFVDDVASRVQLYRDGVIYHDSFAFRAVPHPGGGPRARLRAARVHWRKWRRRPRQRSRSVGYHAFNLVAMTMLRDALPAHAFWDSARYRRLMAAAGRAAFRRACEATDYAYPYNPVGFELAFVERSTGIDQAAAGHLAHQLALLELAPEPAIAGAADQATGLARSYELARVLATPAGAAWPS